MRYHPAGILLAVISVALASCNEKQEGTTGASDNAGIVPYDYINIFIAHISAKTKPDIDSTFSELEDKDLRLTPNTTISIFTADRTAPVFSQQFPRSFADLNRAGERMERAKILHKWSKMIDEIPNFDRVQNDTEIEFDSVNLPPLMHAHFPKKGKHLCIVMGSPIHCDSAGSHRQWDMTGELIPDDGHLKVTYDKSPYGKLADGPALEGCDFAFFYEYPKGIKLTLQLIEEHKHFWGKWIRNNGGTLVAFKPNSELKGFLHKLFANEIGPFEKIEIPPLSPPVGGKLGMLKVGGGQAPIDHSDDPSSVSPNDIIIVSWDGTDELDMSITRVESGSITEVSPLSPLGNFASCKWLHRFDLSDPKNVLSFVFHKSVPVDQLRFRLGYFDGTSRQKIPVQVEAHRSGKRLSTSYMVDPRHEKIESPTETPVANLFSSMKGNEAGRQ